jgi:hypothetical protein
MHSKASIRADDPSGVRSFASYGYSKLMLDLRTSSQYGITLHRHLLVTSTYLWSLLVSPPTQVPTPTTPNSSTPIASTCALVCLAPKSVVNVPQCMPMLIPAPRSRSTRTASSGGEWMCLVRKVWFSLMWRRLSMNGKQAPAAIGRRARSGGPR